MITTKARDQFLKKSVHTRIISLLLVVFLLVGMSATKPVQVVQASDLLLANFDSGQDGFSYLDDAFGTSQPDYADGSRITGAVCDGGNGGCLNIALGGIDGNDITGMSGGWSYTLSLDTDITGILLSFRYRLDQTAKYEYDEFTRFFVKVDDTLYGRGSKDYVDHIGGDGDSDSGSGGSNAGNSNTFLPTTEWQSHEIYLEHLAAGPHTIILGAYNNKKTDSNESSTAIIDNVSITSANPAPVKTDAQILVDRSEIGKFLEYNQGIAQFHDRCRGSNMGCSSTDYSTNYYAALRWVELKLQDMGYTTVRHNFTYNINGSTGTNLYATKVGSTTPTEMYMVSTHLDGRGGGDGFDDDGSGVALVLELARVLSAEDVNTEKSVRFIFWDKEEVGLHGAYSYVQDRRLLQGTIDEPTWLGLITHDMILYDHGVGSPTDQQSTYADLDVEWRAGSTQATASKELAMRWRYLAGEYMTDYPANAYNYSTNTDDTAFHSSVASISVRENRRSLTSGTNAEWINPYYHKTTDVENSYLRDDDGDGLRDDVELGFNAVQATLGVVAELAGASVTHENRPPVADAQSVSTDEDMPLEITLNGSDPDGAVIYYTVVDDPAKGTLSGDAPDLTYTPDADFNGADSFTFTVNDGTLDSAPATISITINPVNDAPVAMPLDPSTNEDTPVLITLGGTDVDGDPLTYSSVSSPANGLLSGVAPSLTYTPKANFDDSDGFTYVVNDGTVDSLPANVTITVNSVNDAPVAYPQNLDTPLNIAISITLTGSDVEGDSLSFNVTGYPQHGSLEGTPPSLTYTPTDSYAGTDSFSFVALDGEASSAPALVSITVGEQIFFPLVDSFDSENGWQVNPFGTDSSSSGQWERNDPQGTDSSGPKQLDRTTSETLNLVTGHFAGSNANKYDVDGVTTIISPAVQLPSGADILLSFKYYFAHGRNATTDDFFRVQVVGDTTLTILEVKGSSTDVDADWQTFQINLSAFAGQKVKILLTAADRARDSLVEAAVDDLSIEEVERNSPLLSANFDAGADGFTYLDDAFRGTIQPAYASGTHLISGCEYGGCLQVNLGGLDTDIIKGISAGWTNSFTLAAQSDVMISFWYKLSQSADYDSGEFSQMLLSVDGLLYGSGANDYIAQVNGNGNGGIVETTGWRLYSILLKDLAPGLHPIRMGGYNNQKSYTNESTEILIDQVVVEVP